MLASECRMLSASSHGWLALFLPSLSLFYIGATIILNSISPQLFFLHTQRCCIDFDNTKTHLAWEKVLFYWARARARRREKRRRSIVWRNWMRKSATVGDKFPIGWTVALDGRTWSHGSHPISKYKVVTFISHFLRLKWFPILQYIGRGVYVGRPLGSCWSFPKI